jgi:hypothetical protein
MTYSSHYKEEVVVKSVLRIPLAGGAGHPASRYRFPIPIVPVASRCGALLHQPAPVAAPARSGPESSVHATQWLSSIRGLSMQREDRRRPGAIPGLRRSSAPPVSSSNG